MENYVTLLELKVVITEFDDAYIFIFTYNKLYSQFSEMNVSKNLKVT